MASARRPNTSRNGTVTPIDRAAAPPHNTEAELGVLGAMMLSKASIDTAAELLTPEDFYNPAHGNIWAAIVDIWADGSQVDSVLVAHRLQEAGLLEACGGGTYIMDLHQHAAAGGLSGRIGPVCDIVAETAKRRRLIHAAYEAIHAAETGGDTDHAVTALVDDLSKADGHDTGGWEPLTDPQIDDILDRPEGWDAPTLMQVTDGPCLLYPGKVHSFAGESGSAKSWLLLVACCQAILAGHKVLYIDFEDSGGGIFQRLIDLGLTRAQAKEGCLYIGPTEALTPGRWRRISTLIEKHQPVIAVIDGVTEAMDMFDLDLLDNRDTARFLNALPRKIARLGPAVGMIDHVTKSVEGRRGAIGAQHKKAGLDGAAYVVEALDLFGRGKKGRSRVVVDGKDRSGYVNAAATAGGTVAYLELQSWPDGGVSAHLSAPQQSESFEPTVVMEKVSRYLQDNPGLSKNAIETAVKGRSEVIRLALELLVSRGYVNATRSARGSIYESVKPFIGPVE